MWETLVVELSKEEAKDTDGSPQTVVTSFCLSISLDVMWHLME